MDDEDELGRYESKRRLTGHYRSATCVSYGRLELVSGHEDGERDIKGVAQLPTSVLFLSESADGMEANRSVTLRKNAF